ncbi:hypothetical protein LUZ61_015917 [Rhynchospora tenuis]|uniref:F-box domain-containing protein n=1 Tax=Rhynchospora tenuis TaxID=198213 RepID=A0AAD5Z4K1_9POAL|nr:hypothetical protein LUZ61_015917 [Rhynchospora tenuis]
MTTRTQPIRRNAGEEAVPYVGPDRLSDLPDALRLKIFSSLDAREVAQTCILSKRWRNLWASVPCLHFDYAAFSSQPSEGSHKRFMKFVTSFLLSIDKATKLDIFHLSCCLDGDDFYDNIGIDMSYFACVWITVAVERKLKKLQLELLYYDCLRVPDSLFVSKDVCFGNLKLLSVSYGFFDYLDIPFTVPRLEYLFLDVVTIDRISSNKIHKLTEASITCHIFEECDVLGSLVNVEVLQFRSSSLMDVLEKALQKSLIFDKLRRLTLGECCMICAFDFLSSLLEHTPKLENLTLLHEILHGGKCWQVNGGHGQKSRENIGWFYCKCLKKVEISCTTSDGVPQLVQLVKLSTMRLNGVLVVVSNL